MYPVTIPVGCVIVYGSEYMTDKKDQPVQKSIIEMRAERQSIKAAVQANLQDDDQRQK